MSIQYHPDDDHLVRYAAGELSEAWSLLVATHNALCLSCRTKTRLAEAVGGVLVTDAAPTEMSVGALEATMARALNPQDDFVVRPEPASVQALTAKPVLPQPLRGYAGGDLQGLRWRRLGRGAYYVPLMSGRGAPTARLLRIPAGRPVPEHGHKGLELTMVLQGAFTDGGKRFGVGDVEAADSDLEHQPVAEPGEDCICLAVTDAPLRFRGLFARMVQPFIGI
ncbi:MAG: ChrR family anti-sigma-E factor [Alphaproteobacteria bacterium]|nr:ChrR family anti-sigma-E factor [Alphaproteobacteria bacterium]